MPNHGQQIKYWIRLTEPQWGERGRGRVARVKEKNNCIVLKWIQNIQRRMFAEGSTNIYEPEPASSISEMRRRHYCTISNIVVQRSGG